MKSRLNGSSLGVCEASDRGCNVGDEQRGQIIVSVFGHVVAALDRIPSEVGGPGSPDVQYVSVEGFHVVPGGPQDQGQALHRTGGRPVGVISCPVDAKAGPVVLDHGLHNLRIVDAFR